MPDGTQLIASAQLRCGATILQHGSILCKILDKYDITDKKREHCPEFADCPAKAVTVFLYTN
ncbi:hypothetical protein [Nostoc sp.]|uniref:hypothetical protein n=1 Tax=Nostoc sp. TaxID=1180 RepID=UPI002FF60146